MDTRNATPQDSSSIKVEFVWQGKYYDYDSEHSGSEGYEFLHAITLALANGAPPLHLYLSSVRDDINFSVLTRNEKSLEITIPSKKNANVLSFASLDELRAMTFGRETLVFHVTGTRAIFKGFAAGIIGNDGYYRKHESTLGVAIDFSMCKPGNHYKVVFS